MRVTFIIPPSGFLLDERVFPTLGVLKVAAALEPHHDVRVLDLAGVSDVETAIQEDVLTHGPADVYGVTATMPQMPQAARIATELRSLTDARLILGGPHVTLMNASTRLERVRLRPSRAMQAMVQLSVLFDVCVAGDGERAMLLALQPDSPRVVDADDPQSDLFLTSGELNAASFPARHLIDIKSYHYQIDGVDATSLIAQLGCPFGCTFCGGRASPFLRRVRTRSAESVVAELRHLYESYGYRGFMFFDDELNVNREFITVLRQISELQDELGVEFRLRGFLKSELITEPMARAMYLAGFRQVCVGFESGHPRILENIQKRATVEDNTRAVNILHKHGLQVKALMSLGHAGEAFETIETTRQWLLEVEPDDFDATIITVYPGTPYWDEAKETTPGVYTYTATNGDRLHGHHVDHLQDVTFYKGIPHTYQSFVSTDHLSASELCTLRDELEDSVRSALHIPYPGQVAKQFDHSMGMRA